MIKSKSISDHELQKYKNKIESSLLFSEASILNKAFNLAYFESIGELDLINKELEIYEKISAENIRRLANEILVPENANLLVYEKEPA